MQRGRKALAFSRLCIRAPITWVTLERIGNNKDRAKNTTKLFKAYKVVSKVEMEIATSNLAGSKRRYTDRRKKEKLRRCGSASNIAFPHLYNLGYHYNRRHTTPAEHSAPPTIVIDCVKDEHDELDKLNNNYIHDEGLLNPSYALDAAVASNDSRLLHGILSAGNIMLDTLNASGGTAMHEAAFQGKVRCLEVFLKFGTSVDIRDKEGWTPLHAAVCGGDIRAVIFLIKNGASLQAHTKEGVTPVEIAMDNKDKKMVQALSLLTAGNRRFRMFAQEA